MNGQTTCRLREVADFQSGGTPSKANPAYWNGSIPWLTPKDMAEFDGSTHDRVTEAAIGNGTRLASADALFIAVRGMSLHNEIRVVRPAHSVCFNQDIKAIIPRGIDRDFLYYALLCLKPSLLSLVESAGHGTGVLPTEQLANLPISRLSPKMEDSVASVLRALDNKIDVNRRMNRTLESIAQAIFKDWFVDFGPTRSKQMGGQSYLAEDIWKLFPGRLNEDAMPEGWTERRVQDILELVYGRALKASERIDGSIPVYGSGGITGYHNQALVDGPSIIVGRKGTVGSLYWEDGSFFPIDTVFYVRAKVPLSFCYYHLQTLGLTGMNTDAAVPGLNRNNVYRLAVPWGPDELHKKFDESVVPLRHRIRSNSEEIGTLSRIRDLLLPKLMSGEMRIGDAERIVGIST